MTFDVKMETEETLLDPRIMIEHHTTIPGLFSKPMKRLKQGLS